MKIFFSISLLFLSVVVNASGFDSLTYTKVDTVQRGVYVFNTSAPLFTTPTIVAQANGITTTLNLTAPNTTCELGDDGANQFELNGRASTGGTGIPMQWAWTWSKQSYSGAGTGKAVFENIHLPQTQVDSLDVGTYVFQGSAVDLSGGTAGTATVTVIIANPAACTAIVTDTVSLSPGQQLNITGEHYKIHYVRAGNYGNIYGNNCGHIGIRKVPDVGMAGRANWHGDCQFGDCCVSGHGVPANHIYIDGGGVSGLTGNIVNMGFKFFSDGASGHAGIFMNDSSPCLSVKNIEMVGVLNAIGGSNNGQGISGDIYPSIPNDTITPNQTHTRQYGFNAGNFVVKNCYIHSVWNEGIYAAPNHTGDFAARSYQPMWNEGFSNSVTIDSVKIDSCGQAGINAGGILNGCSIKHSSITNIALLQHAGHEAAISIGPGNRKLTIDGCYGYSALAYPNEVDFLNYQGLGDYDIMKNCIMEGFTYPIVGGRSTDANEGLATGTCYVENNTIINPYYALILYTVNFSTTGAFKFKNNIVAGTSMTWQFWGGSGGLDSSNNMVANSGLTVMGFINASSHNFGLTSSSPARSGGLNLGVATDYYGNTRTLPVDIGAIMYIPGVGGVPVNTKTAFKKKFKFH
jgi:hypothetical protein